MKTDGPRGVWLIANSPLSWPYPCRCHERGRCTNRCPCRGRPDTYHLPPQCCGRAAPRAQADHPDSGPAVRRPDAVE